MVAGSNKELDDLTRPHNMIAKPGPIMKRKAECMKYFHDVEIIPGSSNDRFHWTPDAEADLEAAICDAGLEDQPLVSKDVKMVFTIFLKSTSGKGVSKQGGAGVPCLPSF